MENISQKKFIKFLKKNKIYSEFIKNLNSDFDDYWDNYKNLPKFLITCADLKDSDKISWSKQNYKWQKYIDKKQNKLKNFLGNIKNIILCFFGGYIILSVVIFSWELILKILY
jgi:hypothetical protein